MSQPSQKDKATIAARAGGYIDISSGGVVPPMQPSTTFIRDENYESLVEGNVYGRDHNDQVLSLNNNKKYYHLFWNYGVQNNEIKLAQTRISEGILDE